MRIRIIDALAPFTAPSSSATVNWSKVRFADLETNGELTPRSRARIITQFTAYAKRVAALGYTALSLDDLAHLCVHDAYSPALKKRLGQYGQLYRRLFTIAKQHGLDVFVNTDYAFCNETISTFLKQKGISLDDFFADMVQRALREYPSLAGVVLRVGENDGLDVARGDFLSRLALRTPRQARTLLTRLLPVFEARQKTLIFRTWSVGAHSIGDLIWNPQTFDAVFAGVTSPRLIISMKFGDTDFMRYLKLNPLFFRSEHKKIVELQTRREWEGMGMYPSFVGWDYEEYIRQLQSAPNLMGVHVWCQTGGWAKPAWANATFVDENSFWDELNTVVTAYLCQGQTTEAAIVAFCKERGISDVGTFMSLLRLAEVTVNEGLYIKELAEQPLYFRRSRLPSLMWIVWDGVLWNNLLAAVVRVWVKDPAEAIRQGFAAAKAAERMMVLGKTLHLPISALTQLQFGAATFSVLAQLRKHLLGSGLSPAELAKLKKEVTAYNKAYPQYYNVSARMLSVPRAPRRLWLWAARSLLRRHASYRFLDHILLMTSPLQHAAARAYFKKSSPQLTDKSMGIEVIFT